MEDSRLGFLLPDDGSFCLDEALVIGFGGLISSVDEEAMIISDPSSLTITGMATPSGVTACCLVLTVGVPLDCDTSSVAGESKGGGECPVWSGVDIAGRYSNRSHGA